MVRIMTWFMKYNICLFKKLRNMKRESVRYIGNQFVILRFIRKICGDIWTSNLTICMQQMKILDSLKQMLTK